MTIVEKVLIIGDDMRSFLATVRSLGRRGLEVHAAPYDHESPALASRFISRVHHLPYYLDGGDDWFRTILTLLRNENFRLVIPCDERGLLPLMRHESQLRPYSALAIPTERALDAFFDKKKTRELATSLDIPVARGGLLDDTDTTSSIMGRVALPIIVKHRKSYTWPDLYVRSKAAVLATESELSDYLAIHQSRAGEILFEQMFPGIGVGISVLCIRGRILQAFEHHRVREFRGNCYYRKSAPIDPERLAAVTKIVAQIDYTGLGMFEFKVDPCSGKWILLEINARPWGSLPLPVALGVDFPHLLYRLLVKDEASGAVEYRDGVYGRNLLEDLTLIRAMAQTPESHRNNLFQNIGNFFKETYRFVAWRETQDSFASDDLAPGILEMKSFASRSASSLRSKLHGRKRLHQSGLREKIANELRASALPIRTLILCEGNICRSPYAEAKLKQLLGPHEGRFEIRSGGMLPRNRRPSTQVAVEEAARRGIDLAKHHSIHASLEFVRAASIILVFDAVTVGSFRARYPSHKDKLFLMGEMTSRGGEIREIMDPLGKPDTVFDSTYEQIDCCLREFADCVCSST